jgi:hypothetical protein
MFLECAMLTEKLPFPSSALVITEDELFSRVLLELLNARGKH